MNKETQECFDFLEQAIRSLSTGQGEAMARLTAIKEYIDKIFTLRWDIFGIGEFVDKMSRERKTFFFKIGKAFRNRDNSVNLKFNALPIGQCQMRDERERIEDPAREPTSKFENLP